MKAIQIIGVGALLVAFIAAAAAIAAPGARHFKKRRLESK